MVPAPPVTDPHREAVVAAGIRFLQNCRPTQRLTLREWVEAHVVIPTGQRGLKGRPFRVDNNPWAGHWFDAIDSRQWPINVLAGPTQSGKSLCGFVCPTLYDAHALREGSVLAIPEGDMVNDKWQQSFLPVLQASPELEWLIPTKGEGSRGGDVRDLVLLSNRVLLKMMTRGGKDTGKAGYTTSRVKMTEAAAWSHASERSKEASPFWQIYGRLLGFKRAERQLIVEGTVTVANELPWLLKGEDSEKPTSTDSKIAKPCPHCGAWVTPGREHLKGWQDAESVIESQDKTHWICPACGVAIGEDQRRQMNLAGQLLHRGQSIVGDELVGDDPAVEIFYLQYDQFDNQLLDAGDIGAQEWLAAQKPEGTEAREDEEKRLCQQIWARPFQSTLAEAEPLKPELIRRRRSDLPRNVLPADTTHFVIAADCGKWTGWWLAMAVRASGVVAIPAYGAFDVCLSEADEVGSRLRAALCDLFEMFDQGFDVAETETRMLPQTVWVDRGWMKDVVCDVVRPRGTLRDNRYRAAKGFGKTSSSRLAYRHPSSRTPKRLRLGNRWYQDLDLLDRLLKFNFDADYYKLRVHELLRTEHGKKGSLEFCRADTPNEHAKLTHHLCAEQFMRRWLPGRGFVDTWVKTGQNHLLDCAAMCLAALDYVGFRLVDVPDPPPASEEAETESDAVASGPVATAEDCSPDNWYARMLGDQ